MANNVDFTNERPYDQNEHARALKSACANRVDGMNYANGNIESGYGIIFGSPFQVDATNISGSGYITINVSLSESGNAGIGNVSITKESTRQNVDNGSIKKYSIYKVDGTNVIEDYRYSDIIKNIELGGSGNKVHFEINGVKSNDYTLPITPSGSVDLSNYYTKQEIRNLNIDYKYEDLGNLSNGSVRFNPNDYDFIIVSHYDKISYVNYQHPIYHKQNTANETTYTFGDTFFTETNGDITNTLMRLKLSGLNTTSCTASITAYRVQIGSNINYTSYKPNRLIGIKMVVKS
jgi:hypothetical protein